METWERTDWLDLKRVCWECFREGVRWWVYGTGGRGGRGASSIEGERERPGNEERLRKEGKVDRGSAGISIDVGISRVE